MPTPIRTRQRGWALGFSHLRKDTDPILISPHMQRPIGKPHWGGGGGLFSFRRKRLIRIPYNLSKLSRANQAFRTPIVDCGKGPSSPTRAVGHANVPNTMLNAYMAPAVIPIIRRYTLTHVVLNSGYHADIGFAGILLGRGCLAEEAEHMFRASPVFA